MTDEEMEMEEYLRWLEDNPPGPDWDAINEDEEVM